MLRSLGAFVVLMGSLGLSTGAAAGQASFAVAGHLGSREAVRSRASSEVRAREPEGLWGLHVGLGALAVRTALSPNPVPQVEVVDASAAFAARAIGTADLQVGSRYRWGGASPAEGFDCSGFVRYVFGQHGIPLPRTSRDQARAGRALPTSLDALEPGDLLFFAQRGPTVDHVAIYAGEGRIVHASRSGYGVRYDELTGDRGRWYAQRLVAVRRVIDDADAMDAMRTAEADAPHDAADDELEDERADEDAPPPQTR